MPNLESGTIKGDSNLLSTQMDYIGEPTKYLGMQCRPYCTGTAQVKFFYLKKSHGGLKEHKKELYWIKEEMPQRFVTILK